MNVIKQLHHEEQMDALRVAFADYWERAGKQLAAEICHNKREYFVAEQSAWKAFKDGKVGSGLL